MPVDIAHSAQVESFGDSAILALDVSDARNLSIVIKTCASDKLRYMGKQIAKPC